MKNFLESLAIFLVGILSIGIVYLIIQYNMIQDENVLNDVLTELAEPVEESGKSKTESYLDDLEGYEDIDLDDEEIDATKENLTNTVTVVAEEVESALDDAVEDKSKSSYMENLENYQEVEVTTEAATETTKETVQAIEEVESAIDDAVEDTSGEPIIIDENSEIVDEVGMAIDAALEDL